MALASQPISLPQPSALPAAQSLPTAVERNPSAVRHLPHATSLRLALLALVRWWHLLSLDAPTVAALWAFCFARAFHLALSPCALPLLFTGTWLLYVADRILDGLHSDPSRLRDRHLFYIRHRAAISAIAVPVCGFLVWLILFHMLPVARRADVLIFSVAAAYFLLVHLCGPAIECWFPKELIVAVVFASASAVPTIVRITPAATQTPAQDKLILVLMSVLFAALCWLNCIAIDLWEQFPRSASHRLRILSSRPAIADRTTRWGQRHLRLISIALAAVSILAAALLSSSNPSASALCCAAAAAALLFIALDRSPFSALHLRIAADAALLTPLLLLILR
ncbi:MAG TPA: hypothetical protein VMD58_03470 [Acidobacteriaceae bacterium]|nr:hypothetical protein [Acidobacteriaceae bacterium]